MDNLKVFRTRYTQFFVVCILSAAIAIAALSLSTGFSLSEKSFWNRRTLISAFTNTRLMLGDKVFLQALVLEDGWLEYTGDSNLDDFQNAAPNSRETLESTRKKIRRVYNALRDRNITLLIVIAPNKATIYPDKLPASIQKLAAISYLDALLAGLQQDGLPILLDLRPSLQAGRKTQEIYYRTDTHWNAYGGFIAYTEIIQALSKTRPQLKPRDISKFNIQTGSPYLHDIPKLMGANNMLETNLIMTPKKDNIVWSSNLNEDRIAPMQVATTKNKNAPTLLIYIDSFGKGLKDLLPSHFRQTTFIQNDSKYADLLSMQKIDTIKPDFVIIEFVERSLYNNKFNDLLNDLLAENK